MSLKNELIKRKEALEIELNEVNVALNALIGISGKTNQVSSQPVVPVQKFYGGGNGIPIGSPKGDTWLEQIINFIKDSNRFVHNREIADAIAPLYPNKDMKQVKRRISSVLSHAITNNRVKGLINYRFSKSKKDTVWGKTVWLTAAGDIKNEHLFKKRKEVKNENRFDF